MFNLNNRILEASGSKVKCMCGAWIEAADIQAFLNNSKFDTLLLKSALRDDPSFHECPNAFCENGAFLDENCENFNCDDCRETCGWCRGPAHPFGTKCNVQKKLERDELWNKIGIMFNPWIKRCPSCKSPILKNGGCKHMKCKCGFQFCWHCKQAWASHNRCPLEQALAITVIPPLVVSVSIGTLALATVVAFAGGVSGNLLLDGKPIFRKWLQRLRKFFQHL